MLIFALFGALASYSDAFLSINKAGIRSAAQSENSSYTGEAEEDDIEALVTSEEAVKDLSEDKEGQGGERDCGDVLVFRGETPGRVRCATGRW